MSTLPHSPTLDQGRFLRSLVAIMAIFLVIAFATQLTLGRSSFSAPIEIHIHALTFFGWVALFATQAWLGTKGPIAWHRRLGWIGAGWIVAMIVMGTVATLSVTRRGVAPFFFQPQHFLIANPLGILSFAVLAFAAIRLRRKTDWHWRLHVAAFALLLGPGFGRLLPAFLLIPWAFEISVAAGLLFPVACMIRDKRRDGRVHHAWWWGLAVAFVGLGLPWLIARTSLGDQIYQAAMRGSPGAQVPGMEFPPLPPGLE